ncbi:MAG: hypothetical protein H8D23_29285 [Candidatus Brocadiales bacterium]|nr:hypothetical protein [Candidatus Brocadiales bacterium]
MRSTAHICSIIMIILLSMVSLVFAGPATIMDQSDMSEPLFVADMDGVLLEMDYSVMLSAIQPGYVNVEQPSGMNDPTEGNDNNTLFLVQDHTDIRAGVVITNYGFRVLKLPTCNISESLDESYLMMNYSAYRKKYQEIFKTSKTERDSFIR